MKQLLGVGIAMALALAGCGSGGTKTVTVTSTSSSASGSSNTIGLTTLTSQNSTPLSTSSTTTTSSSSTASVTLHLATFKSPSANIGCMIIAGTARCDIVQRTWRPPPRPASCPNVVDFGQGLIVTSAGSGHLVCAGDTTRDPMAAPLPYNQDTVLGGFRCASSTAGMTCTNTRTGHGFFIAIQGYRTF